MSDAKALLIEHLLEHSVRRGDFTLKSGKQSNWFLDAKPTCCRAEGIPPIAHLAPEATPDDVGHWLDPSTWDVPPIFGRIQELGEVSDEEMAKVFNLGIGMVLVVAPADADRTIALLAERGHAARAIGEVTKA